MQTELKKLWREAFGDEEDFLNGFFETAFSPDRCSLAREQGELAAMLFWLDCIYRGQKMAYLYAVATAEKFRGRGCCRRLMADTHRRLQTQGYAAAILYPAGEGLRKMYGGMGYLNVGRSGEFSCQAGEIREIRPVSGTEYGQLRKKFLPGDGVDQPGENLRLLEKCAGLYAGPDFLLAANREGKTLRAGEFLGNKEAAPGVLTALGCKTGTFRQGVEAMILPLQEGVEIPGYFGLAFD